MTMVLPRDVRQQMIFEWVKRCFGERNAQVEERAARFFEEAIELMQAVGLSKDMMYHIIDAVHERPVGEVHQEFGGVGLTLLALAAAAGQDAEACERREFLRVINMPDEHFIARQTEKSEAGLGAVPEPCPEGLLPDGPRCPRCGGLRAASGVDGGTWVHTRNPFNTRNGRSKNP